MITNGMKNFIEHAGQFKAQIHPVQLFEIIVSRAWPIYSPIGTPSATLLVLLYLEGSGVPDLLDGRAFPRMRDGVISESTGWYYAAVEFAANCSTENIEKLLRHTAAALIAQQALDHGSTAWHLKTWYRIKYASSRVARKIVAFRAA